jgi:hypothetical protein
MMYAIPNNKVLMADCFRVPAPFFTLLCLFLCHSFKAGSQSLSGEIRNKVQEPIPYSVVRLHDIHAGRAVQQALTDSMGKFHLASTTGTFRLEVYSLGCKKYISDTIQIQTGMEPFHLKPILLEPDSDVLNGVEIVADKKKFIEHKHDQLILHLGDSPLAKELTGMEALQLAPGVQVNGSKVTVEGREYTEIWVNGKRSRLDLNTIPAEQIERIEIIANPSAVYDASADAIINIVLKKWANEGFNGQAAGNYRQGFYPGEEAAALLNFNSGSISSHLELSGGNAKTFERSYFLTHYPSSSSRMNEYQTSLNQNVFVNGGGEWKPAKHQLLSIEGEFQKNKSPLSTDLAMYDFYSPQGNRDSTTNSLTNTQSGDYSASLRLNYALMFDTLGRTLTISAEYYTLQETETNKYAFGFQNPDGTTAHSPQTYRSMRTTGATVAAVKGDYSYPINKTHQLALGFKASDPAINSAINFYSSPDPIQPVWAPMPERSSTFQSREQIYAAYLTWNGSWKKWNAQAGLRGERTDGRGTFNAQPRLNYTYADLFPSASIDYSRSKNNQFVLSYSRKIFRPGFSLLNPYISYTGPYTEFVGSPDIKPQYNDNTNFTWIFREKYSVQLFYTHNHNRINQISEQDDLTKTTIYRNINFESENSGCAIDIPVEVCPWLSLKNSASGSFQDDQGTIQGTGFYRQALVFQVSSMQSFKLPYAIRLKSSVTYHSASKWGIVDQGPLTFFGLSLGKTFAGNKLEAAIKAEDIFHTYTETFTVKFSNQDKTGYHVRDMQAIRLMLTWKFEKGKNTTRLETENAAGEEKERVK